MACSPEKAREALTKAFQEIDADKSGSISVSELEKVLVAFYKHSGKPADPSKIASEAQSCIRDLDKNKDGKIDMNEFINYFMQFCK